MATGTIIAPVFCGSAQTNPTPSGDITTTNTYKEITSMSHTTRTGKYVVIASLPFLTSRYTSVAQIHCAGTAISSLTINKTSSAGGWCLFGVRATTKGATETVKLGMYSQDSGTTARVHGYNTRQLLAFDIPNG